MGHAKSSTKLDVIVVDDSTVAYDQSAKMTALAAVAGAAGADWVVPCDGTNGGSARRVLA